MKIRSMRIFANIFVGLLRCIWMSNYREKVSCNTNINNYMSQSENDIDENMCKYVPISFFRYTCGFVTLYINVELPGKRYWWGSEKSSLSLYKYKHMCNTHIYMSQSENDIDENICKYHFFRYTWGYATKNICS